MSFSPANQYFIFLPTPLFPNPQLGKLYDFFNPGPFAKERPVFTGALEPYKSGRVGPLPPPRREPAGHHQSQLRGLQEDRQKEQQGGGQE